MAMKEIVKWLQEIEHRAETLYSKAALVFKEDDPELSSLINRLGAEESEHLKYISKASGLISGLEPCAIELNQETICRIEGYFRECEESLETGGLTTLKMLEMIVNAEFSEWNDIFLYTIKLIKEAPASECSSIIGMQYHKNQIKEFIESRENAHYAALLETIKNIPDIWNESILIVDDEPSILEILENVLVESQLIEKAVNGEEALNKLGEKYFAAIITDIRMPILNGMEFYELAIQRFPNIRERFIFFTASNDREVLDFIEKNGLKLLKKPTPIGEIKKVVREVIDKANG